MENLFDVLQTKCVRDANTHMGFVTYKVTNPVFGRVKNVVNGINGATLTDGVNFHGSMVDYVITDRDDVAVNVFAMKVGARILPFKATVDQYAEVLGVSGCKLTQELTML